jgi:hypothetical protein
VECRDFVVYRNTVVTTDAPEISGTVSCGGLALNDDLFRDALSLDEHSV